MDTLHCCIHIAMHITIPFITRIIHNLFKENQIDDCMQECIKLLHHAPMNRGTKMAYLASTVYIHGNTLICDRGNPLWSYHYFFPEENGSYNDCHEAIRNKISFAVTCILHRAFSGWCVVSMDLDDQTLMQKKCRRFWECTTTEIIVHAIQSENEFLNLKIMPIKRDLMRPAEWTVTMSFPTRILPKCREFGLKI